MRENDKPSFGFKQPRNGLSVRTQCSLDDGPFQAMDGTRAKGRTARVWGRSIVAVCGRADKWSFGG